MFVTLCYSRIILRVVLAGGLVTVGAAAVGFYDGAAHGSTPQPSAGVVSVVADQISGVGEGLPSEFTGIVNDGGTLEIYSTAEAANLRAGVAAINLENVPIAWHTVPNSLSVLSSLTSRLQLDSVNLSARGIDLVQWGPDPTTGKVEVGLLHYTPEAESTLLSIYGSDKVEVDHNDIQQPVEYADRFDDSAPWYGADQLSPSKDNVADCTSGAGVNDSYGHPAVVTAGHCYSAGTAVYNGQTLVGHVSNVLYNQGGVVDAELIRQDGVGVSPWIWDNFAGGNPTKVKVIGYNHDQEYAGNGDLFVSGAETKLQYLTSVKVGMCVTFKSGHQTCDVTSAASPGTPSDPTTKGDSGGPVFEYGLNDSTIARIHGYLIGGNDQVCYFATERNLINAYNATLATY